MGCILAVLVLVGVFHDRAPAPVTENLEIHYEIIAETRSVIDGDTITVTVLEILPDVNQHANIQVGGYERVRFGGGIDAPEFDPPEDGALEAKLFVENLLPPGTTVYLDLNDAQESEFGPYRDRYGRIVAVIYVKVDGRWINVNAELLRWGRIHIPNNDWLEYAHLPSEWNAAEWLDEAYPFVSGKW